MKSLVLLVFAAATVLSAQQPTPKQDAAPAVTVKDTPSSRKLVQAAQESALTEKSRNDIFQQARTTLDANQKTLNDQLTAVQKDLQEKLKADKKYKPMFDQITDLQKKITDLNTGAQAKFNQDTAPIMQKISSDNALVDGLIPIVREENGFPETATFDKVTQKWTLPKSAEPAKK